MPNPTVMISATPIRRGLCASAQVNISTNIPNVHGVDSAAVSTPEQKIPGVRVVPRRHPVNDIRQADGKRTEHAE